jgi:hypothetical protein
MNVVPDDPREFFEHYVKTRYDAVIKPAVGSRSSEGALTAVVIDAGAWTFRIRDGALGVVPGKGDDVVLQVTVRKPDFAAIFVVAAEQQEQGAAADESYLPAFKALLADAERVALIKNLAGSVAFVIDDGGVARKLVLTPGSGEPNFEAPECRLECTMSDFLDMQLGKQNGLSLVMNGRIRIAGNAQLAVVLASAFA